MTNEYKRKARRIMVESQPRQIGAAGIFVTLSLLFSFFVYHLSGYGTADFYNHMLSYSTSGNYEAAADYLMTINPTVFQKSVIIMLVCVQIIIEAGFCIFILNSVRKNEPCYGNLLDAFPLTFKLIIFTILKTLLLSLGFLLFVVPGFFFLYTYRLTVYILIDNPGYSAFKAMKESRQLMKGHRIELFKLDLSFIFWIVLQVFSYVGTMSKLLSLPWRRTAEVLFYDNLTGRVSIESVPEDFPVNSNMQ